MTAVKIWLLLLFGWRKICSVLGTLATAKQQAHAGCLCFALARSLTELRLIAGAGRKLWYRQWLIERGRGWACCYLSHFWPPDPPRPTPFDNFKARLFPSQGMLVPTGTFSGMGWARVCCRHWCRHANRHPGWQEERAPEFTHMVVACLHSPTVTWAQNTFGLSHHTYLKVGCVTSYRHLGWELPLGKERHLHTKHRTALV